MSVFFPTATRTRNWIVDDLLRRKKTCPGRKPGRPQPPPPPPTVCSTRCLITSMRDTIVGASINCRHKKNRARAGGRRRHLGPRATPAVGPPSAAQERREPVTSARHRRSDPLYAADPLSCGLTSQSRLVSSSNDNSKISGWSVGGSRIVAA